MPILRYISGFLCVMCVGLLHSNAQSIDFAHIDNTDGLANNQVECIFKDSKGFMWFGTATGLNRFDGRNFRTYKNIPGDHTSIPFNQVVRIFQDVQDNIWFIADGAMAYYYYDSDKFTESTDSILNLMGMPPMAVKVYLDDEKNLYAWYEGDGVYRYDPYSRQTAHYRQSGNVADMSLGTISDVFVRDGMLWVAFVSGRVERIDLKTGRVNLRDDHFVQFRHSSYLDKSIYVDTDGEPWLYPSISDYGVAHRDSKSGEWHLYNRRSAEHPNDFVRDVTQDHNGRVWIGIDQGGIMIIDKKSGSTRRINHENDNPLSICSNSIICLYCDNDGIVWTGSFKNGISYHHYNLYKFKRPDNISLLSKEYQYFDCNRIWLDMDERLWLGTNGQGLIRFDENRNDVKIFRASTDLHVNTISSDIITSLLEDSEGVMWIGTFMGGMNSYSEKDGFHLYYPDSDNPNMLSNKSVFDMEEDSAGNIWIATLGAGLECLDTTRTMFTHYNQSNTPTLYSNYLTSMFMDRGEDLYMCTAWGTNLLHTSKRQFLPCFDTSLFSDYTGATRVNYLIKDSRGQIWAGTDSGIDIYNSVTRRVTHLGEKDGMASEEVVSMVEDNDGHIWAGTHNGLVRVECRLAGNDYEYSISRFTVSDGLPNNTFNLNAVHKDRHGNIYFGTIEGYVRISPSDILMNDILPEPTITDITVSGVPFIMSGNKLQLRYNQTNLTIKFSAMNYIHPEKNRFRYRLEGLEDRWTEIKNGMGEVVFSNLHSGRYKLVVYASNDDLRWAPDPVILNIEVCPPFWASWWAFVIYILLAIAVIQSIIRLNITKQTRKFELDKQKIEAAKMKELYEMKFRFFTNISHEFKTPLSLIISPLEKLMKDDTLTRPQRDMLNMVQRNANNLLELVTDILDFRKMDMNKMTLNLSTGDIIAYVRDITQSFSEFAIEKKLKLTFYTYIDEMMMDFDQKKVKKIVTNLLSNAIKYTPQEGTVEVSMSISEIMSDDKGKRLCIKVSDTGIGISKGDIYKIFDRFFTVKQKDSASTGSGIGLHMVNEFTKLHGGEVTVNSVPGKGTTFLVYLPIRRIAEQKAAKEEAEDSEIVDKRELPTLLVVDDNADFREFVKGLFTDTYKVITAVDGEEAWNRILEHLPSMILSDVMMEGMDGYQLCRKIKDDIRTSHIPVILLTAKNSEESRYEGIEAGADDYICKPFNIDMLVLKISKILEKQKKLQNVFRDKIDISPNEIEITSLDEKFVKRAVNIVEANISNTEFLVSDLCSEMNMSRVYFYKKLLALTDKTPSEFIRFIRIKRAAELLDKGQMYVGEVAFQVGFNDPKYFRKYFKEVFGVSPNEYKKNPKSETNDNHEDEGSGISLQ